LGGISREFSSIPVTRRRYPDNEQKNRDAQFAPKKWPAAQAEPWPGLSHRKAETITGGGSIFLSSEHACEMSTVASMWQYQEQKGKAHEIADLAGKLCNKFCDSIDDLNTIRKKIAEALNTHDGAMRRLFHGKGNALSIMEGIRGRRVDMKPIPSVVIGDILIAPQKDEEVRQTSTLESTVPPTEELPQNGKIAGTFTSPKEGTVSPEQEATRDNILGLRKLAGERSQSHRP
jgi:hypothetical protein